MSPHQLFISGMLRLRNSGLTATDFFDNVNQSYGDEEVGLVGDGENSEGVAVPSLSLDLNDEQMQRLREQVNALEDCEDYGVNLYQRTIIFLNSLDIQ